MWFTVLGPVAAVVEGERHTVRRAQTRGLLALLLLNAGRPVSRDAAAEALWGGAAPSTASSQVQGAVYAIRRWLAELGAPDAVAGGRFGYLLAVPPEDTDLGRFDGYVDRARGAAGRGDERAAVDLLREALSLWQGEPLADAAGAFVESARARLIGRRLAAVEELADLRLRLGEQATVAVELAPLVDAYPMREPLRARLMTALCRDGRRVEALEAYRGYRLLLAEREGLDPGAELAAVHLAILRGDASVTAAPAPGRARAERAPGTLPAQLPADASCFTGRADHLGRLDALLESGVDAPARVVLAVIAGTAGVGKTALAVHWGHRVRDRFPDGQLHVDLRGFATTPPLRPIEALTRFLHALGVAPDQVPLTADEAAALYRSILAERRVLIVLDNACDADQVRPLLPGSPGCAVVVTSRDEMAGLVARDGARRVALDVLDPAESHDLLARLLGRDRAAAEPAAVAELAEVCAHLPLALRIAAANIDSGPMWTVDGYVAEVRGGDRLAALAVAGDTRAAVAATFDLSYANLPAPARRLFRLIGLVPGPDLTADAAAALVDATREEASHLLGRLAQAHLLDRVGSDRFTCHDLLREYAAERALAEDGAAQGEAAIARLLDHFLYAADAAADRLYPGKLRLPLPETDGRRRALAFVDDVHAAAWLDAEQSNLVAAITHAAKHGPRPVAWLLADALRGYFHLRMHAVDWLTVAETALAAAEAEDEPRAQTTAHLSLASLHWRRGRYPESVEHHHRALALAERCGWPQAQAAAFGTLGTVYAELGRLSDAAEQLRRALEMSRRLGEPLGIAMALGNLGLVLAYLGRMPEAAELYEQAIPLYREAGHRNGEAITLANLGTLCHDLGRSEDARAYLNQAFVVYRELADPPAQAVALVALAENHCDTGRFAEAVDAARTALGLSREVGRTRTEAGALNILGRVHAERGEHEAAIEQYRQALRLAREGGDRSPELAVLIDLSQAYRHLGTGAEAVSHATEAVALAARWSYRMHEGQARTALAATHLDAGELDAAIEEATRALAIHRETGHRRGEAETLALLGDAARRCDGPAAAVPHWRQARALYTAIGAPHADMVAARRSAAEDLDRQLPQRDRGEPQQLVVGQPHAPQAG